MKKVGFLLFLVTVSSSTVYAGRGLLGKLEHEAKKVSREVQKQVTKAPKKVAQAAKKTSHEVHKQVAKAPKTIAQAASSSGHYAAHHAGDAAVGMLLGVIVGASVHEEQSQREVQRRRDDEARREAQRKRDTLAAQDRQERLERESAQRLKDQELQDLSDDYDTAQRSILNEDALIECLTKERLNLETSLEEKESEIESWEQGADDRQQNRVSLQQQLDAAKKAYEQRWEQSQGEYERRLCAITHQGATQLHEVCAGQTEEKNRWVSALEKEKKTLEELRTQKEALKAKKEENEHAQALQERALVDAVVQSIVGNKARINDVLRAVELVGGDREILRAAQQRQDVSFLVDLIMSGKFKVSDLSTVAGKKVVPKSFFRAARYDLQSRVQTDTLQLEVFSEWLAQLERFGHSKFFCCYC